LTELSIYVGVLLFWNTVYILNTWRADHSHHSPRRLPQLLPRSDIATVG